MIVQGGSEPSVSANSAPGAVWVQVYGTHSADAANDLALSPSGRLAFVTGTAGAENDRTNYVTFAYEARTGKIRWRSSYDDPNHGNDYAAGVAVSPDGARVFVTGQSWGGASQYDYVTVAYEASSGRRLWVARYDNSDSPTDEPYGIVATKGRVFVTGASDGVGVDAATVAYASDTGKQLWVQRYDSGGDDGAYALAANRDGTRIYVAGYTETGASTYSRSYLIAAYRSSGDIVWVRRYRGPRTGLAYASDVTVSRAGTVVITGRSPGPNGDDIATVAYSPASGRRKWVRRYDGPGHGTDVGDAVRTSPDGKRCYVTGSSQELGFVTIAYALGSGATRWNRGYHSPGEGGGATAIAVSANGETLFVTGDESRNGGGSNYTTVAYHARRGDRIWVRRFSDPGAGVNLPFAIAPAPRYRLVIVTGQAQGASTNTVFGTVAYHY